MSQQKNDLDKLKVLCRLRSSMLEL